MKGRKEPGSAGHGKLLLPVIGVIAVIAAVLFLAPQFQSGDVSDPVQSVVSESKETAADEFSETRTETPSNTVDEKPQIDSEGAGEGMLKGAAYSGQVISGSATPYIRYNHADYQKAVDEGKAVYVYFYAAWCPLCQSERPKIVGYFEGFEIENAVGFEAHWNDGQNTNEDDDAARRLGVFSQHTHVFVGKDGKVAEKVVSALSEEQIRSKLSAIA